MFNTISQESILFQKESTLFKYLVNGIEEVRKEKASIEESLDYMKILNIIKEFTGLTFDLKISYYGPAVQIPHLDRNNILVNSIIRNMVTSADGIKTIRSAKEIVKGTVDIKNSKVSGIFEDMKIELYMPEGFIRDTKYKPEHIAAVILHEVGHTFTYCEYISRTVTTNQVLAGVSKALDGSNDQTTREMILLEAKKELKLDFDSRELEKSNNKTSIEVILVHEVVKKSRAELGTNIVDMSTWEYLADEFAARHGAGRYLVEALAILYKSGWHKSFRSTASYIGFEALKLLMLFVIPGVSLVFIIYDSSENPTYDVPGARFIRVRNQIVENLKDKSLTKNEVEALQADIHEIDSILSVINDRRQFFGVLYDFITLNKSIDQRKLQQELEALAANELFVKAAQLRNM